MSFQKNTLRINETMPNTTAKTTLNPHAAEFVPFSHRPSSGNAGHVVTSPSPVANHALGKAVLDRNESSVSTNSEEEARQYWGHQLPDDITPDFKFNEDAESQEMASHLLGGLSLDDSGYETSKFVPSVSVGAQYAINHRQELSSPLSSESSFPSKPRYALSSYDDDYYASELWGTQARSGMDTQCYTPNGFVNNLLNESSQADDQINPIKYLTSQFPGYAAESLAEVYYASQCDLNLTIEMLTQLELQVDVGFNHNSDLKTVQAPNLNPSDFPALSGHSDNSGLQTYDDDIQLSGNSYSSADKENLLRFKTGPSIPVGGAVDFAAAVKKLASQNSGTWKYEKPISAGSSIGSSRSSQLLANSFNNVHGGKSHGSSRAAPVWLETGEAVGNMYSEMREEARDNARVRNAYFEQARQAYLTGNKALAKELSAKGQLYNMRMKEAHGKAQESIYRQRNPVSPEMQLNERGGQERMMIDLHGLHVSEAIHKLKQELSIVRNAAMVNGQRIQVFICVGTGHHTRGSRTPVRLPVAVQQFLLDEGIHYSETQPGLLRVVI